MEKLDQKVIQQKLADLDGWYLEDEQICKKWQFRDFKEAMAFINRIAELAELHNHHPEIWNVYNQVKISYSTHDAGGITEKDFLLAKEIDKL